MLNKIDRVDEVGRRRLANRFPGAPQVSAETGEGLDELKARIAERFASRFERVRLLLPYEEGARLSELYALGAPIERARGHARRRAHRRAAAAARAAPLRAVPDRRGGPAGDRLIELPIRRLHERRRAAGPRLRGRRRPRPRRLRARRARARRAGARRRPGSRSRSRRATPGFVQPRSGLAAKHGITIVNSPGLVDSGYRGELRVNLLNTDPAEPFVVEPGMRIAQLVVLPVPELELVEVDELPDSERGVRGFGSSRH